MAGLLPGDAGRQVGVERLLGGGFLLWPGDPSCHQPADRPDRDVLGRDAGAGLDEPFRAAAGPGAGPLRRWASEAGRQLRAGERRLSEAQSRFRRRHAAMEPERGSGVQPGAHPMEDGCGQRRRRQPASASAAPTLPTQTQRPPTSRRRTERAHQPLQRDDRAAASLRDQGSDLVSG